MKVAILLSGLPRMVEAGYELTWKHIINRYNADVYLHAWKDTSWGSDWKTVESVYNIENVKALHIQTPFKFTRYKDGISLPHTDKSRPLPEYDVISCFRQLPMFYSWQKVYQDCYDTRIDYDIIIRSRYDMQIFNLDFISTLDLNSVSISRGGGFLDDNIAAVNYANGNILFHNIFDRIVHRARLSGILNSAEQTWTNYVNDNNCKVDINDHMQFKLLRENMLWWGE